MEIHAAHSETAKLDLELIQQICTDLGAIHYQATTDPAKRKQQMWQARHHLAVVLLVFGVARISKIRGELGKGINAFRQGVNEGKTEPEDTEVETAT